MQVSLTVKDPSRPCDALVLGGSGAVGRFLLRRLNLAGRTTIALSRSHAPAWSQGWSNITWCVGGLPHTALANLPAAPLLLSAGPLDALTEACQIGLPPAVRRVVALSSLSIQWKRDSPNSAERTLAARLASAEDSLQQTLSELGVALVLLRPGMIYGAGVDQSLSPLLRFARRFGFLPWPSGGRGLRCPVHADDVAAALVAAALAPGIPQGALSLPGPQSLPFDLLLDQLLTALASRSTRLPLPIPFALLRLLAEGNHRLAQRAATAYRSAQNQTADLGDWQQLGIVPRAFAPLTVDFTAWEN